MISKRLGIAALMALAGVCALAQQMTLSEVLFKNAKGFAQVDLEAAAGVHTGDKVTTDQIRAAAQRLIDTGFFDDVNVDSKGGVSALRLVFITKPVPADQIARCTSITSFG